MRKLLCVVFLLLCCAGSVRASLTDIKFYLLQEVYAAQEAIPEAEKKVLAAQKALANYKEKTPTMYYVQGGVKREAIDGELLNLAKAVNKADEDIKILCGRIRNAKTELKILCNVPDAKWDMFWKQLEMQYKQRRQAEQKKFLAQVEKWKAEGKTDEQIQELLEAQAQREVIVQERKEEVLFKEMDKIYEQKERANKSQGGALLEQIQRLRRLRINGDKVRTKAEIQREADLRLLRGLSTNPLSTDPPPLDR